MYINEYFKTPIWMEEKPEFVKSLNKASDKYIKEARKMLKGKNISKQILVTLEPVYGIQRPLTQGQ